MGTDGGNTDDFQGDTSRQQVVVLIVREHKDRSCGAVKCEQVCIVDATLVLVLSEKARQWALESSLCLSYQSFYRQLSLTNVVQVESRCA